MRHLIQVIVAAGMLAAGFGSMALGAAPTTQPGAGKVRVLSFAQTSPGAAEARIAQSIRQGMLADLMPYAPTRFEPLNQRVGDDKEAIDAARKSGAAYVVTGNIVTVGPEVRFDGLVLEVENARTIAALKATGPADNLYAVQTALANQLGRAIGLPMPAAPLAASGTSTAANQWGTNDYLDGNPYEPGAENAAPSGGADFGSSGYGGYAYGPYLVPVYVYPRAWHQHNHGNNSFNDTAQGGLGVPSIAGGGGTQALNGGMPYGLFIPTNRAESRVFNRYGGLGTVDITRPAGRSGSAHPAGSQQRR